MQGGMATSGARAGTVVVLRLPREDRDDDPRSTSFPADAPIALAVEGLDR
jgi:hypothetical protein